MQENMQEHADPTLVLRTADPEETRRLGAALGERAMAGDVFLLSGPLGAGKTCFTQGLARGLGVSGYVRSPTFVLMTRHHGRLTLHHVDLYRIGSPEEAWDLGLDEQLFDSGVCVIEWAERAEDLLPDDAIWIEFDYGPGDEVRDIVIEGMTQRHVDLFADIKSVVSSLADGGEEAQ